MRRRGVEIAIAIAIVIVIVIVIVIGKENCSIISASIRDLSIVGGRCLPRRSKRENVSGAQLNALRLRKAGKTLPAGERDPA